jgi:uncharacterized protein
VVRGEVVACRLSRNCLSALALLLTTPVALPTWARTATFDCNKASNFVEKSICSDSRLTSMDDQLGRLYKDALAASSNSEALKTEQKAWLSLRNQCKDSDCIIESLCRSDHRSRRDDSAG